MSSTRTTIFLRLPKGKKVYRRQKVKLVLLIKKLIIKIKSSFRLKEKKLIFALHERQFALILVPCKKCQHFIFYIYGLLVITRVDLFI